MARRNPTRSARSKQTPPAGKAPETEKPATAGTKSEPPPSPVTFAICWPGPTHLTNEEIRAQKQAEEEMLKFCPPLPDETSDFDLGDLDIMEEYAGRLPHRCPDGPKGGEWEAWFDLMGRVCFRHRTTGEVTWPDWNTEPAHPCLTEEAMPKDLELTESPPSPVTFAICRPGPTHLTNEEIIAQKQVDEEMFKFCPPLPAEMIMEDLAGQLPCRCPGGLKDGVWETWFDLKGREYFRHCATGEMRWKFWETEPANPCLTEEAMPKDLELPLRLK